MEELKKLLGKKMNKRAELNSQINSLRIAIELLESDSKQKSKKQ